VACKVIAGLRHHGRTANTQPISRRFRPVQEAVSETFGIGTGVTVAAVADDDIGFPTGSDDEKELLLQWLGYLRGAVRRNLDGLDSAQVRWTPGGKLIPLIGIVQHLTRVEWRWIDGAFAGVEVSRSEEEFRPGPDLSLDAALMAYREQATVTDARIRSLALTQSSDADSWGEGKDLRWVVLHLINETARHAGHADATREMLDGKAGE
jgi:hypothetical protein